jgi:prepilin-type N-terminal cleavage/methylation domain-containing protein
MVRLRTLGGRLARDERGFQLMEMLVSMAIAPIIVVAALGMFSRVEKAANSNQRLNESQQRTRHAMDRLARDLRNLSSPTPEQPLAIDKATAYDLVFQTVDPAGPNGGQNSSNVRRVRFCLDAVGGAEGTLWMQSQTWTSAVAPAMPATSICPSSAWANQTMVAQRITNRKASPERAIFGFNSAVLSEINAVRAELYASAGTPREPREGRLATEVFLRNQNQVPAAGFTATPAGNRHVLLNGSISTDPEGEELTYTWFDGGTQIGTGITLDYTAPTTGVRSFTVRVADPAGLVHTSDVKVVNVT